MDGLSTAGGVLAVVSFALQLAETVNLSSTSSKMWRRSQRNSQRFMQPVLQLDLIVENVIIILKREESKRCGQTSFFRSIQDVILNCMNCLDPIVRFMQDNTPAARKK
jgi:hypothetical protein